MDNLLDEDSKLAFKYFQRFTQIRAQQPFILFLTLQLSVVNLQPAGSEVDLAWKTSDSTLATVDKNGIVTSVKPGDVTISATGNGVTRKCLVHFCYRVSAIQFEDDERTSFLCWFVLNGRKYYRRTKYGYKFYKTDWIDRICNHLHDPIKIQ